jgi:hypothetical protein
MALLCLAFATLALDGTRMLANGVPSASSLRTIMQLIDSTTYDAFQSAMRDSIPYLWTTVLLPLIVLPAWMVLGGLGALLFLTGYKPPPPEIIADDR